jgi:hypothetical protein
MFMTTRMKLVMDGGSETPLSGVKVALYDRDEIGYDDYLDTGITDANGEILFKFDSTRYTDAEDSPSWRLDSLPDLYVVIYDAQDRKIYTTRSDAMQDKLPKQFTITLTRSLVEKHALV